MALLDLLGGRTPPVDREPVLRDPEQILAYLEQLLRLRSEMDLRLAEDAAVSYGAWVERVDEEHRTFTLGLRSRPAQEPRPGTPVFLWFTLDGLRFRTLARFLRRGAYMQSEFDLPEAILRAERRGQPRARFSAREQVQVTALERMADGLGLNGLLLNLSIGGILFRVDRAVDLKRDRLVPLRADLLAPGTELAVVRILDLPRLPELEARAVVRHSDFRGEGLVMGLSFEAMGGFEAQALERLLAERIPEFGPAFPRKRRRGEVDQPEEPSSDPPLPEGDLGRDLDQDLGDASLQEIRDSLRSPDRALLLRKRSRQILLVMQDELARTALMGHLYAEGYRCLYEARGMVQALDLARKHNLDMLILEQHVGPHSALEILDRLRAAERLGQARAVVLKDAEDVRLALAAKAGAVARVVPRPLDFEGTLKPFLDELLVPEITGG